MFVFHFFNIQSIECATKQKHRLVNTSHQRPFIIVHIAYTMYVCNCSFLINQMAVRFNKKKAKATATATAKTLFIQRTMEILCSLRLVTVFFCFLIEDSLRLVLYIAFKMH